MTLEPFLLKKAKSPLCPPRLFPPSSDSGTYRDGWVTRKLLLISLEPLGAISLSASQKGGCWKIQLHEKITLEWEQVWTCWFLPPLSSPAVPLRVSPGKNKTFQKMKIKNTWVPVEKPFQSKDVHSRGSVGVWFREMHDSRVPTPPQVKRLRTCLERWFQGRSCLSCGPPWPQEVSPPALRSSAVLFCLSCSALSPQEWFSLICPTSKKESQKQDKPHSAWCWCFR